MNKNKHGVGIGATVFVLVVIAIAWYFLFGNHFIRQILAEETNKVQAEKTLLDITNIDQAYDAILNKSTKNFIGGHPVDETFLGWFCGKYGVEALESIAAYAQLDNAQIWYTTCGSSIHVLWHQFCQETGVQGTVDETVLEKKCQSTYQVNMDFTGDFSLAEGVGTTTFFHSVEDDIEQCIDSNLLQEMRDSDVLVVNNEFTYTNDGEPIPGKDYTFRADPKLSEVLHTIGTDVVGLANNHVYDYGEIGLRNTLQTISDQGLPYIGAGYNLQEASEPVYVIANRRKIAIVAATQIERSYTYTKEATEDTPGVLKTLHPEKYQAAIREAKQNADYVICYVHWGTEGTHRYGSDQYALAKAFAQAGADAIIGGHTHCLQGVDFVDGIPVVYSLGNFYFSQEPEMPEDYNTAMAQVVIEADGRLQIKIRPCVFSQGNLSLAEGEKQQEILQEIRDYSGEATLDEQGYIVAK